MPLFPYTKSVIPLALDAETAENLLKLTTTKTENYHEFIRTRRSVSLEKFQGVVKNGTFKISKKVYYPQNYLPLIKGNFEPTKSGCVVFVEYSLFPGTKFLFYLWSFLTIVIALVFLFYKPNYLYASLAIIFFLLNYVVAIANFNIHTKDSKKLLQEVFEL